MKKLIITICFIAVLLIFSSDTILKAEELNITEKVSVITPDTSDYCKYYFPQMYMQDFAGIKMPNGKDVSESGNLLVELCIIDTYLFSEITTPDKFIEKYPELFLENGNIDIDTYSSRYSSNIQGRQSFDVLKMTEHLVAPYEAGVLVYVPNPSIFGMDSTYLLITAVDNGRYAVRDVNKNNIYLADTNSVYGYHYYKAVDIVTAVGKNGSMWFF